MVNGLDRLDIEIITGSLSVLLIWLVYSLVVFLLRGDEKNNKGV